LSICYGKALMSRSGRGRPGPATPPRPARSRPGRARPPARRR